MLPDFRVRQRDYLLEITRALTEALDLETVLARIVRVAAELLAGRACVIALRERDRWRLAASYGIEPGFLRRVERLLADIPVAAGTSRLELPEVNRRLQRLTEAASMGLLSSVGLPLVARGEVVGVIFVFRGYEGRFTAQDRSLLQAFAAQAAIAVTNARLYTELAAQKRHLDAVVESAADGIFILDRDLRFQRFNPACSRMTGWPEEEARGREHGEVIRWWQVETGPTLEEAAAGGWPLRASATLYVEGDLRRRDGGSISVGITYAPVLDDEGGLTSIVATMRDITRFREAEELKATFISIISHELRTPVALIKGYVGTLRREDAQWDPEVVQQSLAVIEEEADRLAGLIDDLLEASRLQSGGVSLQLGEVALDRLAERLVERFRTQSEKHAFEVDFPPDFPTIVADEERLTQVLSNLLSNAVKYSPEGGTVRVEGRVRGKEVVVCVQDEGPGIPPEDRARIFDRFYRSREAARRTKGAGLGLYLCRAIVEAHGGRIWVDESVTEGARLCFALPRRPPVQPKQHTNPETGEP